jgi:hypothetical protein
MIKEYSDEVYTELIKLVRDDDKNSSKWLLDNNYREWVEFVNAYDGNEDSFQWLMQNGYRAFAATVDALSGTDNAKVFLVKSGHRDLIAFVDASRGNKTAVQWLIKYKFKGLIQLAHEIYVRNKKEEKKGFWGLLNFGNPFR